MNRPRPLTFHRCVALVLTLGLAQVAVIGHTPSAAAPATGAATALSVHPGNGRAWISWTAPNSLGSATGYAVTPVIDGVDQPTRPIPSVATKGYVNGLENGRVTRFVVAPYDETGTGTPSEPSPPVVLPYGSFSAAVDALYARMLGRAPTAAERSAGAATITESDGVGPLVEALRRNTGGVGSDAVANVDPVARLYFAYFLRVPDASGLAHWVGRKRQGTTLASISATFATSSEFVRRYGSLSNDGFVRLIYRNVLGREPEASGLAYWVGQLDRGAKTRGQVMANFSQSNEFQRKMRTSVDVAVVWDQLAGTAPSTGTFDAWVAKLVAGTATLSDLVVAALNANPGQGRWYCLDHPPSTPAEQESMLNHRDDRWRIGDRAQSVRLPDGRVIWLFGDTLYGSVNADGTLPASGWGFVHGSALIQDGACIDPFYSATTSAPTSLIPDVSPTDFFWAQAGWVDATGTSLWILAGERTGSASTGGTSAGTVVARFSLPDLAFQGTTPIARPPAGKGLSWGMPIRSGDWVYVYADSGADPAATWPFDHHVARFPATGTAWRNGTGWQYFDGSGWSTSSSALRPMSFSTSKLVTSTVIATPTGFALVAQPYRESVAVSWHAATPAGPWTDLHTVADLSAVDVSRIRSVHAESTVASLDPFVVWYQAPVATRTLQGSKIGVTAPLVPIP